MLSPKKQNLGKIYFYSNLGFCYVNIGFWVIAFEPETLEGQSKGFWFKCYVQENIQLIIL